MSDHTYLIDGKNLSIAFLDLLKLPQEVPKTCQSSYHKRMGERAQTYIYKNQKPAKDRLLSK